MTSLRPLLSGCLFAILLVVALLLSCLALIGRPDSPEDVAAGKLFDWILIGPLWAMAIYLFVNDAAREHRRRRVFAVGSALVAWVAIALALNWWEGKKLQMRFRFQPPNKASAGNGAIASRFHSTHFSRAVPEMRRWAD